MVPWEGPFVRTSLRSVQAQGKLEPLWLAMRESRARGKNRMVPKEGIEPSHLAVHDFESCASTNSATSAFVKELLSAYRVTGIDARPIPSN